MIVSVTESYYGPERLEMIVTNEQEMRQSMEEFFEKYFAPKPNKIQKHVYGDRLLNHMTRAALKDIVDNNRGMGNTTAHAMKQIAEAIQNPGKAIKLVSDHGDNGPAYSIPGGYRDVVKGIIEKLDLKFLVIRDTQRTLTYEV